MQTELLYEDSSSLELLYTMTISCQGDCRGVGADRGLSPFNKVDEDELPCPPNLTQAQWEAIQSFHRRSGTVRLGNDETVTGQSRRRSALARVRGRSSPGRRYAATVSDGSQILVIDSAVARVRRAARRVRSWANVIPKTIVRRKNVDVIEVPRLLMLTLTYRDGDEWAPKQISAYMQAIRRDLKSGLLAYSWVMEVQERGAPHYHVLLYVRRGTFVPTPDKSGMWIYGSSNVKTIDNPDYIVKYVGKEYQKTMLPYGARMFAVWVDKKIVPEDAYLLFRMSSAPGWLRDILQDMVKSGIEVCVGGWCRVRGGGWLIRTTGELVSSPWELLWIETIHGDGLLWD